MSASAVDYAWLPDHQLHAAATLAHVDQTIDRVARLTHDYSKTGPLTLTNVADDDRSHVMVTAVAALPEAIPRLVADALTQLRAALEHTVYAEVEHLLARPLTAQEARGIEMPACTSVEDFAKWLRNGRRSQLPPLQSDAPLTERIRTLQPFQRHDSDEHPLRLLAEHTNLAKHRTPAVAATRLGAIYADKPHPDLTVALPLKTRPQPGDGLPLQTGDILASGPRHARIPVSVMPTISLRRPHTGVWNIALRELEYLEEWVRTTAIPILITGTRDVTPLPPRLDITLGHEDLRRELLRAENVTATQRARHRMMAEIARSDLADLLFAHGGDLTPETVRAWANALDDTGVLERTGRLVSVVAAPVALLNAVNELLAEVRAYEDRNQAT
ncbi:hypothetical protein ABZ070_24215 [Streptomyces sp. NPDC006283]|uniref:hypothetical protein n=1 Tax=Streptomyces sp. NPDC006283 TaxID=3156741 RepID=UPI0033ABD8F4